MTPVAWWALIVLCGLTSGALASAYYQATQIRDLLEAHDGVVTELSVLRRRLEIHRQKLGQLETRLNGTADTGPINLDRPTPAQRLAPTRPQLAARPPVPSGATAVAASGRGAHRMKR